MDCCADCGGLAGGGISLKSCKSCMLVKYCNADCQRNHWSRHKKDCKRRAAELRDEAVFKDPPDKEDCPICFLPMPAEVLCCISLPPATITSVPISDFAKRNKVMVNKVSIEYYECCGKSICRGCMYSFCKSGNVGKCPFCKTERDVKTAEEAIKQIMKRVEAKDAGAIFVLGSYYYHGKRGLQQDREKSIELWTQAANLGSILAHYDLGVTYEKGGDSKKMMFHYEAAAMAGHEVARFNLGVMEGKSGKGERAIKHWTIAASAGHFTAMAALLELFEEGALIRETIDSTLTAYNNSCVKMRSEARDAAIRVFMGNNCQPYTTAQVINTSHFPTASFHTG